MSTDDITLKEENKQDEQDRLVKKFLELTTSSGDIVLDAITELAKLINHPVEYKDQMHNIEKFIINEISKRSSITTETPVYIQYALTVIRPATKTLIAFTEQFFDKDIDSILILKKKIMKVDFKQLSSIAILFDFVLPAGHTDETVSLFKRIYPLLF